MTIKETGDSSNYRFLYLRDRHFAFKKKRWLTTIKIFNIFEKIKKNFQKIIL